MAWLHSLPLDDVKPKKIAVPVPIQIEKEIWIAFNSLWVSRMHFLLVGIHYRHANKSNKDMFIHYLNIRVFMPTMSTSKELSEETSKTKI